MLVLRSTKKLRDRLHGRVAGPDDVSTTVLGDWFATALFWRPQVALLVNARTLVPVFLPLAPAAGLPGRVPAAVGAVLREHGVDDAFLRTELAAMTEVRFAPTNDRSVVGVMNEFAFHGGVLVEEGVDDLVELSFRLGSLLLGPLLRRGGSPDRELAAVLHTDGAEVVPVRQRTARERARLVSSPSPATYRLKVVLRGVTPPVWRRIEVSATTRLDELHEVIQAAFGWWNAHLYEFEIGRVRYGVPDLDDIGPPTRRAAATVLAEVADEGARFRYRYDFGDGWEHDVTVESVTTTEPVDGPVPDAPLPRCIGGGRACPPEDCGGPWGYRELLQVLADPAHPDHEARVAWVGEWGGGRLDPEAFHPEDFADHLRLVRELGTWR